MNGLKTLIILILMPLLACFLLSSCNKQEKRAVPLDMKKVLEERYAPRGEKETTLVPAVPLKIKKLMHQYGCYVAENYYEYKEGRQNKIRYRAKEQPFIIKNINGSIITIFTCKLYKRKDIPADEYYRDEYKIVVLTDKRENPKAIGPFEDCPVEIATPLVDFTLKYDKSFIKADKEKKWIISTHVYEHGVAIEFLCSGGKWHEIYYD